jgi:hypothetical protein
MIPVSEYFQEAMKHSYVARVRVQVLQAGQVLIDDLPVTGTVSQDGAAWVRWSADLEIPANIPDGDENVDVASLVSGPGVEFQLWWAVVYPGGSIEEIALGRLHPDSIDDATPGRLSAHLVSREAYLSEHLFEVPVTVGSTTLTDPDAQPYPQGTPTAADILTDLIRETLPQAEIVNEATYSTAVEPTSLDADRGTAVADLAALFGAEVHTGGAGTWIIRDQAPPSLDPVWQLATGPEGTVVSSTASLARQGVVNCWIVRGESPGSGYLAVQNGAVDDDPGSPTRWGDPQDGAFGRLVGIWEDPSVTTPAQARVIATARLATSRGLAHTVAITGHPCPILEPGDLVSIQPDPAKPGSLHVIDSVTIPINSTDSWNASTRLWREEVS